MGKNNRQRRLGAIIEKLKRQNGASIKQLAAELDVSEMTIHRDLATLRANDIVKLVHGAAIYNPDAVKADNDTEYHILREQGVLDDEKQRVGKQAARRIEPGDIVIIDIGSTTVHVARALPQSADVTVVCFTVNVLTEALKKNTAHLIFGGGDYHPNTQMFECEEMLQMIAGLRANKYFVSAAGVDENLGLTCANKYEAATKGACMRASQSKILVVDSSKFGVVKPAYFGELTDIDLIITDKGLSGAWRKIIESRGIALEIV